MKSVLHAKAMKFQFLLVKKYENYWKSEMNQATYIKKQSGLESAISRLEDCYTLGCDIETTGLNPLSDRMRLLTVCSQKEAFLIDCFHVNPTPIFPLLADRTLIFHNGLFDLQFLMKLGFEPGDVRDTYLASRVLNAGKYGIGTGLDDCVLRYFGIQLNKEYQKSNWGAGELSQEQLKYAIHDAQVLAPLYFKMEGEAERDGLEWTLEIENECLPAVAWMSLAGIPFNTRVWEEQLTKAEEGRKESLVTLESLAPADPTSLFENESIRNWGSSQDVIEVLKLVTGKSNIESSDDAALAEIDHPIAEEMRNYRTLSSRIERYGMSWVKDMVNGRIYPEWSQLGSIKKENTSKDVGRLSSSDPCINLIPKRPWEVAKEYRKAVEAPEGKSILKTDYSALHFRIVCRMCWEHSMIKAFAEGEDIHKTTARLMYQLPPGSPVDGEQRQIAKSATYALMNVAGAERFRLYMLQEAGINKPLAWSKKIRGMWLSAFPNIAQLHTDCKEVKLETRTRSGRRRLIKEDTFSTVKVNSPILGTEADGLKRALAILWKTRKKCPEATLIIANHDEAVTEVKQGYEEKAKAWLESAMEAGMAPFLDPIPAAVESSCGRTWGDEGWLTGK